MLSAIDRRRIALAGLLDEATLSRLVAGKKVKPATLARAKRAAAEVGLAAEFAAAVGASSGASYGASRGPRDGRCPSCGVTRGMLGDGSFAACMRCSPRASSSGVRFGDHR